MPCIGLSPFQGIYLGCLNNLLSESGRLLASYYSVFLKQKTLKIATLETWNAQYIIGF